MSEEKRPYVVVVGALNIDIGGAAGPGFRLKDSIPGKVEFRVGGVGCNIARALSALGEDVRFLTVLGEDPFALMAREQLRERLSLSWAFTVPDQASSCYLYLNDDRGDLVAAVNDMDIVKCLTPERLDERRDLLLGASLLVLEANLPEETIRYLCETVSCPVLADPVSVGKAGRLQGVLPRLDTIKPNLLELSFFTGRQIQSPQEALAAARELQERGVRRVFVSLGAEGMAYRTKEEEGIIPSLAGKIISTNGAGDTALAVLACLRMQQESVSARECCLFAQLGSALRMEAPEDWEERLDMEELRRRRERLEL